MNAAPPQSNSALTCVSCKNEISIPPLIQNQAVLCPACQREYQVWAFPAFHHVSQAAAAPTSIMVDGEASCFFHPTKTAVTPCDQCGRFLCSLCDLDFGGKHFCPSCIDSSKKASKSTDLETSRPTYDSAALMAALLPMLVWPFTLVTAPTALYFAVRAFRSPGSLVPRKPWRAIVAVVIASLQLLGWTILLISILR